MNLSGFPTSKKGKSPPASRRATKMNTQNIISGLLRFVKEGFYDIKRIKSIILS
nr:MAG TPA: hypothetical protein [Caudoviricetes sp.]